MIVGSVVQALNLLRYLADAPRPMGVNGIARQLGISQSSCFNLLKTLAAEGFADFDPATKHYSLGAAMSQLTRKAQGADAAIRLMRPRLEDIAGEFHIASGLWRVSPAGRLVLVDFVASELATRIHMTVGQRLPMFIGAMGRCVAAYADITRDELKRAYGELQWARAPGFDRYCREAEQVHRQGWATDDGDFIRGIQTIAAPIVDHRSNVRFCIANTLFQEQHDAATVKRIMGATAVCARQASETLFGEALAASA